MSAFSPTTASPTAALPQGAATDQPPYNGNPAYIKISKFDFFYGSNQALYDINMDIPERQVTAFIGPSGCGKSTLLKSCSTSEVRGVIKRPGPNPCRWAHRTRR